MFARLRGIPEKHIKNAVQFEIERLDLVKHANKRCGNYRSVQYAYDVYIYVQCNPFITDNIGTSNCVLLMEMSFVHGHYTTGVRSVREVYLCGLEREGEAATCY